MSNKQNDVVLDSFRESMVEAVSSGDKVKVDTIRKAGHEMGYCINKDGLCEDNKCKCHVTG